jgi:hypothetical protein
MGTWNTKPFGNDTAGDWLWKLEKAGDESILRTAFKAVMDGGKKPDASDCEAAVAAAAVVEAARRQPTGKLPPEARRWVSEKGFAPDNTLVKEAVAALEKIWRTSELRDVWAESKSLAAWEREIETLRLALTNTLAQSTPARKPKAPAAPRQLHKLIEKIQADEESPLREKVREKLRAVKDVNKPLKGSWPFNLLSLLAARGLVPEMQLLIERGANVNTKYNADNDPLAVACQHGRVAVVELLLKHGAAVNQEIPVRVKLPDGSFGAQVIRHPTALIHAVQSGSIPLVELLVRHGANLLSVDSAVPEPFCNHQNMLHVAVQSNQIAMMDFLLGKGANLEGKNSLGFTPLLLAVNMSAQCERMQVIKKLLSLGANVNARDNDGLTALDMAIDWSCPVEVVKLVKRHGGKSGKDLLP